MEILTTPFVNKNIFIIRTIIPIVQQYLWSDTDAIDHNKFENIELNLHISLILRLLKSSIPINLECLEQKNSIADMAQQKTGVIQ